MKSNVLAMSEEEMNGTVSGLDKCYVDTESTGKQVPTKFANLKSSGLFDTGISAISKQLTGLTASIFNVKNIVQKHSTQIFDMDRQMAKQAEKIEIPQDFVKNNSMKTNTFNQMVLEKLDGKSVNTGQGLTNVDEIEKSVVSATNLTDITKNTNAEQKQLDDITNINKKIISNINDGTAGDVKAIDNSTAVSQAVLHDINNNDSLKEQKINEQTTIMNQGLADINNNAKLDNQELDTTSTIVTGNLTNIENDNKLGTQELKDNFSSSISDSIAMTIPQATIANEQISATTGSEILESASTDLENTDNSNENNE